MKIFKSLLLVHAALLLSSLASATFAKDEPTERTEEIPVTIDNFIRAATDFELEKYNKLAGGINRFYHFRSPTPIDNQPTIRMNRDTLYSVAVIDISEGATLTLPVVGTRYMSAMVVNQDHFINKVFHGGGVYKLDIETFDTPYVIVFVRTLVDTSSAEDVSKVNAIQDQMVIKASSATPFTIANYDKSMFEDLRMAIIEIGRYATDSSRVFGAKEQVDSLRHFLGTAVGWGGLPENEAFYLNVEPSLPVAEYKIEVHTEIPVGAFWSISLYNADGFFEKNTQDNYVVNSVLGEQNDDGSMTVYLGGCEDKRVNCLPITEGWNYTVRLYQPSSEIIDGTWSFPEVQPAK